MEKLVCKYCKSEDIKEDHTSGMWYCPYCSRYLDDGEVIDVSEKEAEVVIGVEADDDEYEDYDGEELNALSLIMLNLFMFIPLVNIFVVYIVNKADVKNQYRKAFCYKFIVDLFVFMAVFVGVFFSMYRYKIDVREKIHDEMSAVVETITVSMTHNMDVPEFESLNVMEIIESRRPADTDISDEEVEFVFDWKYIDDSVMSGQKCLELLEGVGDQITVLMQSAEIRNRYTESAYRNLGYFIIGTERKEKSDTYFYVGRLPEYIERYTDDYGEFVYEKFDDLYSKRYIYYLNPKYNYVVRVLYFEDGSMQGLAFEEVSE